MSGSTKPAAAGLLFALVAVWASVAGAQIVALPPEDVPSEGPPLRIRVAYEHRFNADIDNSSAEFDVDAMRTSLDHTFELTKGLSWDNAFAYRYAHYDFSSSGPWKNIHGGLLGSRLRWAVADHWNVFAGPVVSFEGESNSDFGDGVTAGGLIGFAWSSGPDLSLGLAFGAMSQIEDDARFLVIPTVKWRFADDFQLRTGMLEYGSSLGLGAELGWQLTDTVQWTVGAQIQRHRMRLRDSGANSGGVGQERSLPAYVKLAWQIAEPFALELFGGVHFAGELRLENEHGTKLYDRDFDPQPSLGLRATLRF